MKTRTLAVASLLSLAGLLLLGGSANAAEKSWDSVDRVFGAAGKDLPGGVHRFGWPRTDLQVTVGDAKTPVEPALALGSWGAFLRTGKGDEAMAMGDLVLLESEVTPVVTELQKGGMDVLAIHNHLLGERPPVLYVHFGGHGDAATLARALKAALEKTGTPLASAGRAPELSPEDQERFRDLQRLLGRNGAMAGRVLQVGVPRADRIEEHGLEIPPSMGMANSMNFEIVGNANDHKMATTGDFVLVASEVNPVIRELRAGGFDVTALHSHMLAESPRLFFMHFWGLDTPEKVAGTLRAALSKVRTKD